MTFSETLVRIRKAKGLSQEGLAEQLGVSRQAVSKWETGEASPDLPKLMTLSQVLDVSLDTLCGRKNLTTEAVSPPAPILPFPRHVGLRILTVGIAVVLVLAAFFVGRATGSLPGAAESVPLPDSLTITGLNFSYDGYNLHYRFTPSVSEPDYTYQIVFTDYRTSVFDVTPVDGVCSGHVKLPAGSYSVTITVKSGDSTRSVAVAEGLSFSKNHISWIPLTD